MTDLLKQLDAAAELGKAATPVFLTTQLFHDSVPEDLKNYYRRSANLDHAAVAAELRAKDAEIEKYRTVTAAMLLVMRSVAARARECSKGGGRYSMAGVWEDLAPAAENAEAALTPAAGADHAK